MITSLTNERIKNYIKLKDAKERKKNNQFLVEGPHLVQEAKEAGYLVEYITTNENDSEGILVTEEVMKKVSNTVGRIEAIGICKIPNNKEITSKVLILDRVQDPTNLGTILRSAKAFGFDTVFASIGTVDYYNDKVIRGSQGAIFKLNLLSGDVFDFVNDLKKTHKVYGTNVRNGIDVRKIGSKENLAVILGNESKGMCEELNQYVDGNLYIELKNMESLNVSVAASILMYEIAK